MKLCGGVIVDAGNVLLGHWMCNITRINFDRYDYNSIPEVWDALISLAELNEMFGGNVTVVYKASDVATGKIMSWFESHRFTERTGIPLSRVVRTGNGRDKSVHIHQSSETHHGTTVVVDDRLEVLSHFVGKEVPNLFLFHPRENEVEEFRRTGALAHCTVVYAWKEVMSIIRAQP